MPTKFWLAAGRMRAWFSRMCYRRRLAKITTWPAVNDVIVCYGDALKKDLENGIVNGGRVKLLDLQRVYPEKCDAFSILYLVSSALPEHSYELVKWATKRGARFVLNQNGVAYPGWAGSEWDKLNRPNREILALADLVIYQSEYCMASANRYLGSATGKSAVLYNAVDTRKYAPDTETYTDALVLLVAGSHQQPQRVLSVLETLALLVEGGMSVRLILAGSLNWQNADAQVQQLIESLGISAHVEMSGSYNREQAPDLYRRAHILVHTKYKDPCPTVVIEAMACGLPVVGSASGGMPELVGNEGGILLPVPETWDEIPVPAAEALADAVRKIEADLPRWRLQARERAVTRFDVSPWLERHRELLASLVKLSEQNVK